MLFCLSIIDNSDFNGKIIFVNVDKMYFIAFRGTTNSFQLFTTFRKMIWLLKTIKAELLQFDKQNSMTNRLKQQDSALKKANHKSVKTFNKLPNICVTFYARVNRMHCLLPCIYRSAQNIELFLVLERSACSTDDKTVKTFLCLVKRYHSPFFKPNIVHTAKLLGP